MSQDNGDPDASTRARRGGLSEKELFVLLLVGIAVMMSVTGFVLIIN